MSTHELNRAKLALAAAGALPQEELLQVEQHARQCPVCLRELEVWSVYARGLGQLPQPTLPLGLVARTQAKVLSERADAADRRRDAVMLGFLAAFSWASSVAFWVVARALTGGVLEAFGTNWVGAVPWFLASALLAWMTAAAAAITLGRRREIRRTL